MVVEEEERAPRTAHYAARSNNVHMATEQDRRPTERLNFLLSREGRRRRRGKLSQKPPLCPLPPERGLCAVHV